MGTSSTHQWLGIGLLLLAVVCHAQQLESNVTSPAEAPSVTNVTYCKRLFPGLGRISQGLNILTLDLYPPDITAQNGFAQPLFEFTCNKGEKKFITGEKEPYDVPDQVDSITVETGGSLKISTGQSETMKQLKESMAEKVGLELALPLLGGFSLSSSYKQSKENMIKAEKTVAETTGVQLASQVYYHPASKLRLSEHFRLSVEKLPSKYVKDPSAYQSLIQTFGTHYFSMAKFGGFVYEQTLIDSQYAKSLSKSEMENNIKLSFKKYVNVDASREEKEVSAKEHETFLKNTDSSFYFYGGEGKLANKTGTVFYSQWKGTVAKNPWILGGEVKPMWDLITDQSKRAIVQAVALVKLAKQYLEDAREAYELSDITMAKEVEDKLRQIEDALESHSMENTERLEELNKDISDIIDEFQKKFDKPKDVGDRFEIFMKSIANDTSCRCTSSSAKTFGRCLGPPTGFLPRALECRQHTWIRLSMFGLNKFVITKQSRKSTYSLLQANVARYNLTAQLNATTLAKIAGYNMTGDGDGDQPVSGGESAIIAGQPSAVSQPVTAPQPSAFNGRIITRPRSEIETPKSNALYSNSPGSSKTACLRPVPGLDRMAQGVDLPTLDFYPEDLSKNYGYRRAVFAYSCSQDRVWYNPQSTAQVYTLPDQVESVVPVPAGMLNIKTQSSQTIKQLKNSLEVKVGFEVSKGTKEEKKDDKKEAKMVVEKAEDDGKKDETKETSKPYGSFSASRSFKDAQESILNHNKSIVEATAAESAFHIFYKPTATMKLNENFLDALKNLPEKYSDNVAAYTSLVADYGTHYYENAKFGGVLFQRSTIDSKYMEETDERELKLNVKAEFKDNFKVGASMEQEQISANSSSEFRKNSQTIYHYYGGDGELPVPVARALGGNTDVATFYSQWTYSVIENPWLFAGQLRPLWNLVSDSASKRTSLQTAILVHMAKHYLAEVKRSYELANRMTDALKVKFGEFEAKLKNAAAATVEDIESQNRELSKIVEELESMKPTHGDAGTKFDQFLRSVSSDRSCPCEENGKRSEKPFGQCRVSVQAEETYAVCSKYAIETRGSHAWQFEIL